MEVATSCRGPNLLYKNNGNICARKCVKTTITSVKLACMFTLKGTLIKTYLGVPKGFQW